MAESGLLISQDKNHTSQGAESSKTGFLKTCPKSHNALPLVFHDQLLCRTASLPGFLLRPLTRRLPDYKSLFLIL